MVVKAVQFRRWTVYADVVATREAFSLVQKGGSEECSCAYCRNFLAIRQQVYPAEVLALFEQLGVDSTKEVEVMHLTQLDSGLHLYNGWLHLVGHLSSDSDSKMSSGGDATSTDYIDLEQVGEYFQIGLIKGDSLHYPPFRDKSLVQIEFMVELPWILKNEEEPA